MEQSSHQDLDTSLQHELYEKSLQKKQYTFESLLFRNKEIHALLYEKKSTADIFNLLSKNNTFDFNTETVLWQDTDGDTKTLTINRASKTDMWPMGTNYWIRDNAFIAQKLLNLNYSDSLFPREWFNLGKELLLSALTIMSSQAQLKRFQAIIDGSLSADEPKNWPHIFLSIDSNLNASQQEPWMHKQDAWQILCYVTLEALENNYICETDLTEKHKQLLNLVCPFLAKINFIQNNNAGSWEEIDTIRSSVIIWETALLHKIKNSSTFYHPKAEGMLQQGIDTLTSTLPGESPNYPKQNPRYRNADAALLYLFISDLHLILPESCQESILEQTLTNIESLVGTHGAKRYQGDSYQGLSYYTNTVSSQLNALYDSPSGDSSDIEQFTQRGNIVPSGHEAQWTHFIWQLSSVYGRLAARYPKNLAYAEKQKHYFLKGLSLITGDNEWSITESASKQMQAVELPAFQIPECYNTEQYQQTTFQYPSHHTPLYWSIAESLEAFAHMPSLPFD